MKRKQEFYFQVTRCLFPHLAKKRYEESKKFEGLSCNAKWMYVVLCALEHHFTQTGEKKQTTWFFRKDEELAKDCDWSLKTLKRTKAELKKHPDIIKFGRMHWKFETGKKSREWFTTYEIID